MIVKVLLLRDRPDGKDENFAAIWWPKLARVLQRKTGNLTDSVNLFIPFFTLKLKNKQQSVCLTLKLRQVE